MVTVIQSCPISGVSVRNFKSRYQDLLPNLIKFREGSLLEELDEQNIGLLLRRAMTASTQYIAVKPVPDGTGTN